MNTTSLDAYLKLLRTNPAYAAGCALWGGIMPFIGYWTIHNNLATFDRADWKHWVMAAAAAACLVFSIRTVYSAGYATSEERVKAVCWVIGLEGTMVANPTSWLAIMALCVLSGINAIATACVQLKNASTRQEETPAAEPESVSTPDPVAQVSAVLTKVRAARRVTRRQDPATAGA